MTYQVQDLEPAMITSKVPSVKKSKLHNRTNSRDWGWFNNKLKTT